MSALTRRAALSSVAAAALTTPVAAVPAPAADPLVEKVRRWQALNEEFEKASRATDACLATLPPMEMLKVPDGGWTYTADTLAAGFSGMIREYGAPAEAFRDAVVAVARQRVAEVQAARIAAGLPALHARLDALSDESEAIEAEIMATPVSSTAGLAAKLRVLTFRLDPELLDLEAGHAIAELIADAERLAAAAR